MKSSRITLILAALGLAAVLALAPLAIRGGLRYYALNKVLRLPGARARLEVRPIRRTLTNVPPTRLVNLGYAIFDIGSTGQFHIESTSTGAAIILTNGDVSMAFLPPFPPERSTNLITKSSAREARAHPNTLAFMNEWRRDQMAAEMLWEETEPLPPSRVLFMSSDDFLVYLMKVSFKAGNRNGSKRVEFLQGPYVKGIVRVGQTTNDSRQAAVYLASLDDTKQIGLHLRLSSPSSTNLSVYLDPILRSFRFTAETVEDREAVKALIRSAGIQQRKELPTDE